MASRNVAPRSASAEVAALLGSPEIRGLIEHLQQTRWTGRPGYPIRTMVGMALAKSMYALPTWAKLVRLVEEHAALQAALGCVGDVPSQWACYRFARKLRENGDALDACVSRVIAELHKRLPDYGRDIAIDASDMPAYANGQRYLSKNGPERERFSDPDASWGHRSAVSTRRGGGFYGFKLQAAVCTKTGLPVAWEVAHARRHESTFVAELLDAAKARGFTVETCAMDKGYDIQRVYAECAERGCQPIAPLKQTTGVKRGDHLPPSCEHGPWRFAGSDYRRGAAKWRCPTSECTPASTWRPATRLHPLIPRETLRWKGLYRRRAAIERRVRSPQARVGAAAAARARHRPREAPCRLDHLGEARDCPDTRPRAGGTARSGMRARHSTEKRVCPYNVPDIRQGGDVAATLSTEKRLEEVDRQVVAVQQGFVDAIGRLQEAPEVDESFEARWREIADRIKGLRYGLQPQDFDKEQVATFAGILLDMRDSIEAVNAAPHYQDLEAFDSLLVHLERIRHVVRDAIDEHIAGSRQDVGLIIRDIDEWLPNIPRQAVAELAGVDRRTLTRWGRRSSPPTRRMQMVGQLVSILRHNWTEEGIIAWFHRPRRDLEGRTPLAVLSAENFDEDLLLSAARAGRSQYAT